MMLRSQMAAAASAILVATWLLYASAPGEETDSPPAIRCLAFSPNSGLLAAAAADQTTRGELVIWDSNSWEPRFRHSEDIGFPCLAFSPGGTILALSRFAPETKLFNAESGELLRELKGHRDHARCVTFTPDGSQVVTGSYDRSVKIWDTSSGDELATLEGHATQVYHVAVSRDGGLLATSDGRANAAHLWDFRTRKKLHSFEDLGSLVPHVAFSPDGRLLAVSSWIGHLNLFDTTTHEVRMRIQGMGGVNGTAFSLDGKWLAVVCNTPTVYVFRYDTSANDESRTIVAGLLVKFEDDSYEVREQAMEELAAVGPAADAQLREAEGSPSAEVRWRARMLRRRISRPDSAVKLLGHSDELQCVCFSPDGRMMASGDQAGQIKVWSVGDWKEIVSLAVETSQ